MELTDFELWKSDDGQSNGGTATDFDGGKFCFRKQINNPILIPDQHSIIPSIMIITKRSFIHPHDYYYHYWFFDFFFLFFFSLLFVFAFRLKKMPNA